jgi:hypothetical protein
MLAALLFFAQSALATTGGTPLPYCGESKPTFGDNGLLVKKFVNCGKDTEWSWQILKSADAKDLLLAIGETFIVNYTVKVDATAETNYAVDGLIYVQNTSGAPIEIKSITDNLGTVSCPFEFPYILGVNNLIQCTYSGNPGLEAPENVATVVDSNDFAVSAVAPIDWTKASGEETDECVDVYDSFAGFLGTVCANETTSKTFTYTRTFKYDVCGMYHEPNTAKFITNDLGRTGFSSWDIYIDVPCEGGCTLTPGYWKTHSEYGPAPYDDTWALLPAGADTPFFGTGITYYQALWTEPQGGNAYFILAHAYIAAELNVLNGASIPPDALDAWIQAQSLLIAYEGTMEIPKQTADRELAIHLAEILDAYNNGLIGPGHCSE